MQRSLSRAVIIAPDVHGALLAQARATGNTECCGLLLGRVSQRIDAYCPAANVAADPARHFEIDPATLIAAEKEMRAGGIRLLGYYHSHPAGYAVPSITDTAMAAADGRIWAIVAQNEIRFWHKQPGVAGEEQFAEISYKCG